MTLFGVLNDQFEVLTCISRFSGTFSFNKPLKIGFAMVKFILSGTCSHFNLVMSSHVAYVFSTKPAYAFCSFNKRLIWYCGKSINKLLRLSSLENINDSFSYFRTGNGIYHFNFFSIESD